MFKNFLLIIIMLTFALPVFAQNPKETVEYWKAPGKFGGISDSKFNEATEILDKCWDENKMYFVYKEDSEEWNICCAIYATLRDMPLDDTKERVKRFKKEILENPELLRMYGLK